MYPKINEADVMGKVIAVVFIVMCLVVMLCCGCFAEGNKGNFVKGYMYAPKEEPEEVKEDFLLGSDECFIWDDVSITDSNYTLIGDVYLGLGEKEDYTIKEIIKNQRFKNNLLFALVIIALIL